MAFPDRPFPSKLPSFVTHSDVRRYLESYADHFDLGQNIKFHHEVTAVHRIDSSYWSVSVKNLVTENTTESRFDAVFICNGHYSKPYIPDIPGSVLFRGIRMHSTEYRVPERFSKMRIACLGAGPSGVDIAVDLATCAEKVYLCHKGPRLTCPLPPNMEQLPTISGFTEGGVVVGEEIPVDGLIYCTGYEYKFPFLLQNSAGGVTLDNWRVSPLYQHMVNIDEPSMFFIGLCFTILPFPFFYTQMEYACSVLSGKTTLPSRDEMLVWENSDYNNRREVLHLSHKKSHFMGSLQWSYLKELSTLGRFELRVPPVIEKIYEHVGEYRRTDLLGYHSVEYEIVSDEQFVML